MLERVYHVAFAVCDEHAATEGEASQIDLHDLRFAEFRDLVNHAVLDCGPRIAHLSWNDDCIQRSHFRN